jgi:channel protein (hemolysin III family)
VFALWALYATALLRRLSRGTAQQAPLTAYGLSMALLYGASGLYHAVPATHPDWIAALLLLDLGSIHLLIAGTCTALFAALPPGRVRARLTALAWVLAAMGIVARLTLEEIPYPLAVAVYAGPGVVGSHELLHVCDMGGTLTHFAFVMRYVVPRM